MTQAVEIAARGFKIELFHLGTDPHDQERFSRRQETRFAGHPTFIPTPEDVIITKLRWLRAKDREDIKDILAFLDPGTLDWKYLHHWTALHHTQTKLDEIRASIPPLN